MSERAGILLVENDEQDTFLIRYAFKQAQLSQPVTAVWNGEEAIDYLTGAGSYANAPHPLPRIILTDLSMPRMTGFEFLDWLRGQQNLNVIPAIVFSGSNIETDIKRALQLGARKYYVKPAAIEEMIYIAREIKELWFAT